MQFRSSFLFENCLHFIPISILSIFIYFVPLHECVLCGVLILVLLLLPGRCEVRKTRKKKSEEKKRKKKATRLVSVNRNAGLLQASLVSVYTIYLTWTAVTSEPPGRGT